MKKTIALILAIVMASCLLCACGGSSKDVALSDIESAVTGTVELKDFTNIKEENANYIKLMRFDDSCTPEDYFLYKASASDNLSEFGVFQAADADAAKAIQASLEAYIQQQLTGTNMESYFPNEMPKFENAKVVIQGNYVMYAVLDDSGRSAAVDAFNGVFEG